MLLGLQKLQSSLRSFPQFGIEGNNVMSCHLFDETHFEKLENELAPIIAGQNGSEKTMISIAGMGSLLERSNLPSHGSQARVKRRTESADR